MNTDLLNALKFAVAKSGESILSEPKVVSAFLSDLARDVPKPQKNALIKCLEHKFTEILRNVDKEERANCKQKLAEKLKEEEGYEIALCRDTIDLLAAVLFGEENPPLPKPAPPPPKPAKPVPSKAIKPEPPSNANYGTFTDPRDGRVYKTVKIGEQIWMAENLNYDAPSSRFYKNNESNGEKYGRLYNWETAMTVSPPGWHLPSRDEWQTLVDFVGGEEIAGKMLKAKSGWAKSGWTKNGNGTDDFDFSALPGGYGNGGGSGLFSFSIVGYDGCWWSASEYNSGYAYRSRIYNNVDYLSWRDESKDYLFSVRCVQD